MLKLYNTLTKNKDEFKSINPGKVGMYSCGPTVYDYIHIGNIKSYLTADTLRRYLEYLGYEVRHIKNITDVGHLTEDDIAQGDSGEDKLLKRAEQEKKTPQDVADFYENYFHEAEDRINILPAHYFPRATAHIPQMIKIITVLIEKGYAYEKNGNVFFDVTKFSDYGRLSGNTLENLRVGARLEEHPDKRNPWDFALWLKAPNEHLMKFESPWSLGYPGWHVECSAMSSEYLGDTFDIHTGGEDNIFPHHEAEIAQSECYSGKKFVNYWIHTRLLLVDGEKMSKSKGNFYKISDLDDEGYDPMMLRLAIISSHYRSTMNYTWRVMEQARVNLERIRSFVEQLNHIISENRPAKSEKPLVDQEKYRKMVENSMNNDLNTPLALSALYALITQTNKVHEEMDSKEASKILSLWHSINHIFGLVIDGDPEEIPDEVKFLAEERAEAKKNKDFDLSDKIREKIEKLGYIIEDKKEDKYKISVIRNGKDGNNNIATDDEK